MTDKDKALNHPLPRSVRAVAMPLVRLMCEKDLTWQDLETIADALLQALRTHESLRQEEWMGSMTVQGAMKTTPVGDDHA